MQRYIDTNSMADYAAFKRIRELPAYRFRGCFAEYDDRYAEAVDGEAAIATTAGDYEPPEFLFDYQRDISRLAIQKERFAVFADCGLGKTLIMLEFVRHAAKLLTDGKCILIVSPIMVIEQTLRECEAFYGDGLGIERVTAAGLGDWLKGGHGRIGITNYEALTKPHDAGRLAGLVVDESSMLKSHYGKWGNEIVRLGRGLRWKLALTGTPAPNDRIEYANHAVFLDAFPTVNSFLARYFINRGQTENRWELKPHAIGAFYRDLSHWCIFLTNPATYGWKDNTETVPPIHVHIESVTLTAQQRGIAQADSGDLFIHNLGGIQSRAKLASVAKGWHGKEAIDTNKTAHIVSLVESWPDESTIIWCIYNREQSILERALPDAESITGETSHADRMRIIDDFKAGRVKTLISKGKILGFGLNLQIATRQIFSGLQDSYENYYQCIKRSNRIGSTRPLNVHIPITEIERPMVDNVLRKAKRVQSDTEEQEQLFNASRFR